MTPEEKKAAYRQECREKEYARRASLGLPQHPNERLKPKKRKLKDRTSDGAATNDLINTLADELSRLVLLNRGNHCLALGQKRKLISRARAAAKRKFGELEKQNVIASLEAALDDFAPPFCFFGNNPQDSSELGFWIDHALIAEYVNYGRMLKLESGVEPPKGYRGLVCWANDHGFYSVGIVMPGGRLVSYFCDWYVKANCV